MGKEITARQREVLDFIANFIRNNQFPPTLREIGAHLGITSTNGVNDHLCSLRRKGYLFHSDNSRSRDLRLTPRARDLYPFFGNITYSDMIMAIQNIIDGFPDNLQPDLGEICETPEDGGAYVLDVIKRILNGSY